MIASTDNIQVLIAIIIGIMLIANLANTVSEFAGVAASLEIFGVSKYLSVPVAAVVVWLLIVYVLLTQVFRAQADIQQLVRTMGMAAAPLAISVLMFIPVLDFGIGLASLALLFGLTTIAIQASTSASATMFSVSHPRRSLNAWPPAPMPAMFSFSLGDL
jgi:fructose-specific phosphotransferase system IIC component